MYIPVLFLLSVFHLTYGAPVNQSTLLPSNIDPYPSSRSDHCENAGRWQAYAFLVEDCYAAIQKLYIYDVLRHPHETFEFMAQNSRPKTQYPRIRTPAFYTVSKSLTPGLLS